MEASTMHYTLTVTSEETESLKEAFLTPLRAYNQSKAGPSNYEPLVVVLHDESGQPRGGAWGYTAYGWLFVQLLVVPEEARGQGLGRQVMALAEATAVQRGCHDAWLDTHEFQAKAFYEKLGYELFGQLPDYPPPFSRFFFKKRLLASAEGAG
jgi:GNAT superfamily N-acetyltransferase